MRRKTSSWLEAEYRFAPRKKKGDRFPGRPLRRNISQQLSRLWLRIDIGTRAEEGRRTVIQIRADAESTQILRASGRDREQPNCLQEAEGDVTGCVHRDGVAEGNGLTTTRVDHRNATRGRAQARRAEGGGTRQDIHIPVLGNADLVSDEPECTEANTTLRDRDVTVAGLEKRGSAHGERASVADVTQRRCRGEIAANRRCHASRTEHEVRAQATENRDGNVAGVERDSGIRENVRSR